MSSSERHDFSHEDKDAYEENLKDVYRRTYAEGEDKLQRGQEAAGIVAKGTEASADERKTLVNLFDNVYMLPAVTRIHKVEFPNSFSSRMNKRDMIQDIVKKGIGFPTEAEWQTKYSTQDDSRSKRSRSPSASKSEHHRRLTEEAHKRARTRTVVKRNDKKLEVGPTRQHRGQGGQGGQGGRINAHRRRKQIRDDGILAKRLQQRDVEHPKAKEIAMRWLKENAKTELELKRLLETPAKRKDAPDRSHPKEKDYRKGNSRQRENQEKENERRRQRLRREETEAKRKQARSDRGPDHSNGRSWSRERSPIRSRSISLSRGRSRSRSRSPSSTRAVSNQWEEEVTRIVRKVVVEVTSRNKEDKTKRWLPDTPQHLVAKGKALQYVSLAELRKKRPGVKPPEEKEVAESHGMELVLRSTGNSHPADKSRVKWAEWSLLFAELIDLYCVKGGHPEVLEEMLTHQRLILTFVHQRIFTAESCVEYDEARRSAPGAQGAGFSWSFDETLRFTILKEYKPELQTANFLNKRKRSAKGSKNGVQTGLCFDWAEGKVCARSDCKWEHECKTCKLKSPQRHVMLKCPDKEKLKELAKKRKRT